jgi:hypothetical protein
MKYWNGRNGGFSRGRFIPLVFVMRKGQPCLLLSSSLVCSKLHRT